MKNLFLILLFTVLFKSFSFSQYLDTGYGQNGIITGPVGSGYSWAGCMQIQSDNKTLIGGYSVYEGYPEFTLLRYNTDGTPDLSFGVNGKTITVIGLFSRANAMALQDDGKIILAGFSRVNDTTYNYAVVRYKTNGEVDSTFGVNGVALCDVENSSNIYGVGIQTNGKIVLSGYSSDGTNTGLAHVRFNTNGTLDNSFGVDGIALNKFAESPDVEAWGMALDASDRIVTTGLFFESSSGENRIPVVRLTSDGILDNNFGNNGMVITTVGVEDAFGNAITVQSDGKIVVAGNTLGSALILRYNDDGSLDSGFGNEGVVVSGFGATESSPYGIMVSENGKITAAGVSGSNCLNCDGNFGILQLNSNGSIDSSFGDNGSIIADISNGKNDVAFSIQKQSDEKIVLSGISHDGSNYNMAVARFISSPSAITEVETNKTFSLYPNPANNKLLLNIQTSGTVKIYDLHGKMIVSEKVSDTNQAIDISELKDGIYNLRFRTDDKVSNAKFVKISRQ